MGKNLSAVRGIVRQVLKDEFVEGTDLKWEDDELNLHILECLAEISDKCPYMVKEVLTTIANSRVLDISSIEDLNDIKELEYPTGNYPRSLKGINWLDAETIEIDTTLTPIAGGSGTLTGTVTFTKGSAAITGSGTLFETELKAGYHIKKSTGTRWYRIYSIESNTALTLAEPCLDTSGADVAASSQYCYETVFLYCEKPHTITETSSTLSPKLERILIQGVCGYAAISKAQSLIGEINIGGGRTPADMQAWGNGKLAIYMSELNMKTTPTTTRKYSKD